MAESPSTLSTLQRIAETARKMHSNPRSIHRTHPTSSNPVMLKSLPKHKPLLPLLLSYGVPSKLAQTCADRYDKYASQLRSEAETKLAPYLLKCQSHCAGVYSSFLDCYTQALRRWAQFILNAALKSLKRTSMELGSWDVTYQKPLWLPSPPDQYPAFRPTNVPRNPDPLIHSNLSPLQKPGPLCSASTPSHAFPTTYPPPLRPSTKIPSVEWHRTPVIQPSSSSTSTFDVELLCQRFAKSLVIGENPISSAENKASIFSLPTALVGGPRTKQCKRKSSQTYLKSPTVQLSPTTFPLRAVKPRQSSALFSSTPRVKPTPRKASAPDTTSLQMPPPCTLPDSHRHHTPTSSFSPFPGSIPSSNLEKSSNLCTTTHPVSQQLSFNSELDPVTFDSWHSSYSPPMPTTPPIITLDLLSEPVIVSPITEKSFPGSLPTHFVDLLSQYQLQHNYLLNGPLFSPSDRVASSLGFAAGDLCSKGVFDTPLSSDYILRDVAHPYFLSP